VTIGYDSLGNQLFATGFSPGLRPNDITIDASRNIYVTGIGSGDIQTIKLNSSGVQQWSASFNGTANLGDEAFALEVDNSGNVYITGTAVASISNPNITTIKYNTSGIQQWVAQLDGTGSGLFDTDIGADLALDNSANVYVTGQIGNTGSGFDYVTAKYNSLGVLQWSQQFDGPAGSTDFSNSIALDDTNNVYVTGASTGLSTSLDYTTIKYDVNGNLQWTARFNNSLGNGNDEARKIEVDNESNAFITGSSFNGSNNDIVTIKYDPDGNELWQVAFNGTGGSDDAFDLAINGDGNTYVTGRTFNGTNFDFVTIKYNQCAPVSFEGSSKTSSWELPEDETEDPLETKLNNSFKIYPNPYDGSTNISYSITEESTVSLSVYNLLGEKITNLADQQQRAGYYNYKFSADKLGYPHGIYFVRLSINDKIIIQKMVEMR